jgi:DNA-binding NarL/FixJ family response regulator
MLLAVRPGFAVVGEARTVSDGLAMAARERPDLVLLDLDLAGASGFDLLPQLLDSVPTAKVIVLTGNREVGAHREALRRGARGLVLKDKAPLVLLNAIEKVQQGELWFERTIIGQVLDAVTAPRTAAPDSDEGRIASLTAREREIIALVGQGMKNQQIADALFIGEKTARNHLTAIFAKLAVSDRFELALFAYRHQLARMPG